MTHSPRIEIKNFLDCPEVLPFVAEKLYNQWFTDKPEFTREGLLQGMRSGHRNKVPIGLVAFVDGEAAGTVSLIESDFAERKDLSPWLAGLLVFPEFRNYGVGSLLTKGLMEATKATGVPYIYLYTEIPAYYEKLGWQKLALAGPQSEYSILCWKVEND